MPQTTIARRFNGPPGSGNGGYVCGLMANLIDGPSEATLRAPPPLEKPLSLERDKHGAVSLRDGDVLCIAGKGHETGQIVGDKVLPFSDHEAVAAALREVAQ